MAQKFISFYFLDWSHPGKFDTTLVSKIYTKDDEFNNIETQDDYIKKHNLNQRTMLQLDKITEVEQESVNLPVFYVRYEDVDYYLSYSEGNKLIDSQTHAAKEAPNFNQGRNWRIARENERELFALK